MGMGRVDSLVSWAYPKFQNGSIEPEPIDPRGIMGRDTCHINNFLFDLLVFFILLNKYNWS